MALADVAAREVCVAYDRMVRRLPDLTDEQIEEETHAIAANAMVAGDPLLEAAADSLWSGARERDAQAMAHASRVLVEECRRLVPEHRLIVPTF